MPLRIAVLTLLLCSAVHAEAPRATVSALPAAPAPGKWELWASTLGGYHFDAGGGGGQGSLGVTYRLAPWLQPELGLGAGMYARPADFVLRIAAGARVQLPREGVAPYLWLAANHLHEVGFDEAKADPLGAALSYSRAVRHRQGFEAGLGVNIPLDDGGSRAGKQRWDLSFRLSALGMIDSGGPRTWALAELGLGLPL